MNDQCDEYLLNNLDTLFLGGGPHTIRFISNEQKATYGLADERPSPSQDFYKSSAKSFLNETERRLLTKLTEAILDGDIYSVESLLDILAANLKAAERVLKSIRRTMEASTPGLCIGYELSSDEMDRVSIQLTFKQSDQLGATMVDVSSVGEHAAFSTRPGEQLEPAATFQSMFAPIWVQKRAYRS